MIENTVFFVSEEDFTGRTLIRKDLVIVRFNLSSHVQTSLGISGVSPKKEQTQGKRDLNS